MSATKRRTRKSKQKTVSTRKSSRQSAAGLHKQPTLRFTPTAWAKLLFLRDYGDTEVGGFGICPHDPLLVEDIGLVKQECSWATVKFDDTAVAEFFDNQVDAGLRPEQFARVWIHTHPGDCPKPSGTDERTFSRVFGQSDWAVMFILACGGDSYARLRFNVGPQADLEVPVNVEFEVPFSGSSSEEWADEYQQHVHPERQEELIIPRRPPLIERDEVEDDWYADFAHYLYEEEASVYGID